MPQDGPQAGQPDKKPDKNLKTLLVTLGVVAGMVGLSFASVPLYRKLCQITGWGGTTRMVAQNPHKDENHARVMTIRFNSDVQPGMPWKFTPAMRSVDIHVGQDGFVTFTAENASDTAVAGTAVYNVTPLAAGAYFYKTQCFCFNAQVLNAREKVHMPVSFFVDPKILDDRGLRDVNTITLSYTFYRQNSPELEKAVENFIENADNPVNETKR